MGIVLMLGALAVYVALCMVAGRFLMDEKDRECIRRYRDEKFRREMLRNNKPLRPKIEVLKPDLPRLRPPRDNKKVLSPFS